MLLNFFRSIVVFTLFYFTCSTNLLGANKTAFDFNKNCELAYHQIIGLKLKTGAEIIAREKKLNPKNPVVYYLEHEKTFMQFFIEESTADFDVMMKDFDSRYYMVETADENSPYRKYMMAQMQLEIAVSKGKLGQFMTAFFYVRRGYNLLLENKKQFPALSKNFVSFVTLCEAIGGLGSTLRIGVGRKMTEINDVVVERV
jgi:hypothetical protein